MPPQFIDKLGRMRADPKSTLGSNLNGWPEKFEAERAMRASAADPEKAATELLQIVRKFLEQVDTATPRTLLPLLPFFIHRACNGSANKGSTSARQVAAHCASKKFAQQGKLRESIGTAAAEVAESRDIIEAALQSEIITRGVYEGLVRSPPPPSPCLFSRALISSQY